MSTRKRSDRLSPIHPGEILLNEFILPMGLTPNRLAVETHVAATRIGEITHGRRSITAETALRLARYFGTSPEFWLRLQTQYDLETAEDKISDLVAREVRPMARARTALKLTRSAKRGLRT